jgi:transcriptional regulator with XRE-family HTH domain
MTTDIFKNHLSTARTRLGLSQRHVAAVLGLKSANRICALEHGTAMPTTRDSVAFQVLFKRSFEELWPLFHLEAQANADLNIRRLIQRLERSNVRTTRGRAKTKTILRNLAIIVDGLPEDFNNLI